MTIRNKRSESPEALPRGFKRVEIQFGKPVIARVKKCRVVVVRKKLPNDDGGPEARQF